MSNTALRNDRIDLLRGVSICAVLLLHYALAYGTDLFPLRRLIGQRATEALFLNGNYGVTMFFVVSGYLITSMSVARWGSLATIQSLRFYQYRFGRIVPCLALAVAIIVSLGFFQVPYFTNEIHGHPLPASSFGLATLSIFTFWHNRLMQSWGWFNYCLNIYWSLSVEEVFYLALPLVALLLRRNWLIVLLCVALIPVGPIYRAAHAADELYFECGYFACFDAIAMGCLVALARGNTQSLGRLLPYIRAISGLGLATAFLIGIDGHEAFGFTAVAACTATYIWACTGVDVSTPLGALARPLLWMGRHSYELYLFHIIVLALMRQLLHLEQLNSATWFLWLAAFLGASASVSALVSRQVSEPANAAIRRWRLGTSMNPFARNVN